MRKIIDIKLLPKEAFDNEIIRERAIAKSKIQESDITDVHLLKRSIDARGKTPFYQIRVEVFVKELPPVEPAKLSQLKKVHDSKEVIIVGAGPAGYFAALQLIEHGIKPVIFDRGKDVRSRRKDLRAIQQFGEVNPHSNYCFGEGGAGTYSDGKLYTRSHKRGSIEKALKLLVEHGASSDILIDAHPHIGSNKLPGVVSNIRETILNHGGEIHFDSCVTDFIISKGVLAGVVINGELEKKANATILATGHSARDIYYLLKKKGVRIEPKPFALGVRIEHPQQLIDEIQYGQKNRNENLPASSYKLTCQSDERGVFSFCMCPGGLVVPSATAPGEIVVNGMSMSRRDSKYANSGTVVQVEVEDIAKEYKKHEALSVLEFQKHVEQSVFQFGNGSQAAPAQRLTDFINKKISKNLPSSSYIPGLYPAPVHEILPDFIIRRLQHGIQQFGRKMKGYFTEEANVIATESRTSSPVRIPRDRVTFMHSEVSGLFPCGEGAGYAGGIISAAMDGQNVAKAVAVYYNISD